MSTEYPVSLTFSSEQEDLFDQGQQQVVPQVRACPLHYCSRSQGGEMQMDLCRDLCLLWCHVMLRVCVCVIMCVCVCVCVCVYVNVNVYVYVYAYVYVLMYACLHTCRYN